MILHSVDGPKWTHAILVPDALEKVSDKDASEMARAAMSRAHDQHGENWDWDDLVPELEKSGFEIPHWFNGPEWD